jgi:choice-of-anchor A domain-containing protein
MGYRHCLAAGAACLALASAMSASAGGKPSATVLQGLKDLSEINLFVSGNLTSSNEVEGNAWIGGNVIGSGENVDTGASQGGQTYVASSIPSLTVGGNITDGNGVTIDTTLPAGATYGANVGGNVTTKLILNGGGSVTVGGSLANFTSQGGTLNVGLGASNITENGSATVAVGGTLTSFSAGGGTLNVGGGASSITENGTAKTSIDLSLSGYSSNGGTLNVGGNAATITLNGVTTAAIDGNVSNINMSGGSLSYGGSLSGNTNLNGVTKHSGTEVATAATAPDLSAATSIAAETTTISTDLKSLSAFLETLKPTAGDGFSAPSGNGVAHSGDGVLTADVGSGYIVIDVNASQLTSSYNQFDYIMKTVKGSVVPVIVNVNDDLTPGTTIVIDSNDNNAAYASDVLWNFEGATSIQFDHAFDGAVLAPYANLIGANTQLDGSVAVASFVQSGEVHLGTFQGDAALDKALTDGVPEPATWAMMLLGVGALGATLRRRRSRAAT